MDKHDFLNILTTGVLTKENLSELRKLVQSHPSSQLPHFVLAKYFFQTNHPEKEKFVQLASAYAADRKSLKKFIEGQQGGGTEFNVLFERGTVNKQLQSLNDNEDMSNGHPASEVFSTLEEHAKNRPQHEEELGSAHLNISSEIAEEKEAWENLNNALKNGNTDFKNIHPADKSVEEEFPIDTSPEREDEEYFSSDELHFDEKDADIKKKQNDLIEKFIQAQPSIMKGNAVPAAAEEVQDLSQNSITFDGNLVSENLAVIMARQGKIEKAIDIYKKLIWKYPQKKAYFATRIEELKR